MTEHELAALLAESVGEDLSLTIDDFQEALRWLHTDPLFRAARLHDASQQAQRRAQELRSRALQARERAAGLLVAGVTRRLVARAYRRLAITLRPRG